MISHRGRGGKAKKGKRKGGRGGKGFHGNSKRQQFNRGFDQDFSQEKSAAFSENQEDGDEMLLNEELTSKSDTKYMPLGPFNEGKLEFYTAM